MKFQDAYTQVIIVGCLAFCCPGMFNALNGLGGSGAGGNTGTIANATLYGCFAVFGYLGGAFFNLLGNRILMAVGGAAYCVYAIGIYLTGVFPHHSAWIAAISGSILGFGAGWFWTAQGATLLAYAIPEKKGKYISIFWIIFNLGGLVGGFITFGLNYNNNSDESDRANAVSYFVFVAIIAVGVLGAIFLLAPPSRVIREDNKPVIFEKAPSALAEIKGAIYVSCQTPMILLTIPFIASNWFYTYQFSGFNRFIFNIRTRGFNSALYWGSQIIGSFCIGKVLDYSKLSNKHRGYYGLLVLAVELNIAFILGAFVQYVYLGGFEKNVFPPVGASYYTNKDGILTRAGIDWLESGRFVFPFIVYLLYGVGDAMLQTYAYWIMASIAGDNGTLCAQYAGYYKGTQSLGAAVAWAIDLKINYIPQFWICWILFVVSIPLLLLVNRTLPEDEIIESAEIEAPLEFKESAEIAPSNLELFKQS